MRIPATLGFAAAAVAGAMTLSQPANSQAELRGRLLYENHCGGCHTTEAHWRDGRKVDSMKSLRHWVSRWRDTLELDWTDGQTEAVVIYLDRAYYDLDGS